MATTETQDLYFYQSEDQTDLAALLSEESFHNMQAEIKRLKKLSPPASGLGIDHPHYIARTFDECLPKIDKLQQRYNWSRQLGFFIEISERDAQENIGVKSSFLTQTIYRAIKVQTIFSRWGKQIFN